VTHSVSAFQIHVRTEPHVRRTGTRTSVPAFPDSKEAVAKRLTTAQALTCAKMAGPALTAKQPFNVNVYQASMALTVEIWMSAIQILVKIPERVITLAQGISCVCVQHFFAESHVKKGFPNASHSLAKMEEHVWRMNLTKTDFTATALPNIKGNIVKNYAAHV